MEPNARNKSNKSPVESTALCAAQRAQINLARFLLQLLSVENRDGAPTGICEED